MSRDSIVETSLVGLRPVGIDGRRTLDAWDQMVAFIEADPELGPEHARLFAEPVAEGSDAVEWYRPAGLEGEAVPLEDLEEDRQDQTRLRARSLSEALRARADVLRASPKEELRRMGETLNSALLLPAERPILYDVGGQPVLINWGTLNDLPDPPLAVLQDYLRAKPPPVEPAPLKPPPLPPPATAAEPAGQLLASTLVITERWSWWNLLWLLFALLIALLLFLFFFGCGLGLPLGRGLIDYCPRTLLATPALADERARGNALQAEMERLQATLRDLPPCSARAHADAAGDAPPPPGEPDSFDRALEGVRPRDRGEILVTLIWEAAGYPDLDLKVVCPDGSVITYNHRSSCGGLLDVDANGGDDRRDSPVENIYWEAGRAGPGKYRVFVDNYKGRGAGVSPVPFRLRVKIGDEAKVYEGRVAPSGAGDYVASFTLE
ncbi:hypothetical protein SAMN06265365_1263 [Tistlia consotensis]|uniref:Uncharacterized protein n=1 Tax=Tistlia consotensis USBA 355 TaxID=560819 RepID=A0A1Y6CJH9_9PROT|nr:hypothetical protein [Tistlia consotensis]SMF66242.1 hypothetical protein SAMN05428998_12687 [Tistlia consotensis USBA 355]SNS02526.1 hypothetical protein SAMN06265365_1263 [Tistlia consotensis]